MTRLILLLFAVCAGTGTASAHEVRPGYLGLQETGPNRFNVVWKIPTRGAMRLPLEPHFPDGCVPDGDKVSVREPGALIERWPLACEQGLEGEVRIEGLDSTLADVLVRIQPAAGEPLTFLLRATSPAKKLGGEEEGSTPVLGYLRLGIEHILLGIDHLLFVLGLLLIVKDRWMLVKTVTSFTIAHSITLAIATLGYASAPVAPLNAAIALSILFLGPEIVRVRRGETSLTIRHPWVVAFAFGLLHGFGFASGLSTLGLPRAEIPLALLLFNVGVEIGQISFVVLIIALERAFVALEIRWPRWAALLPGYVVGSLGAFWTIQRTAMMLGFVR